MRVLIFVSLLVASSAAATPGQSAYLDVQERFYIEWDYDDTNITILARVKTTGWFGIGFSPNGGMAGADIITAGVRDGVPYLQDRYADKNGFPKMDMSQDVYLISGSETNGETTIKFTRGHNTCDNEDMVVGEDTMRIIYAISPDGADDIKYHKADNRGSRSLYLRKTLGADNSVTPDDVFTVDVLMNNFAIPEEETTYACELMRAPKFDTKHHIIKMAPNIQPENLGVVHHFIVYGCYDDVNRDHYFEKKNTTFRCDTTQNMPLDVRSCRQPIAIWAVGGGAMHFPQEAGIPLGHSESPDYFMMEVHYDNPSLIAGLVDSSGMQFTLTKTLRQHDAGAISAGSTFGIAIPPGVDDFKVSSFCTSKCTKTLMKGPSTIFGAFLHGHLAARQVISRQFRDGKELRVIDQDRRYDFNYQQYRMLETPVDLMPGDDVMTTCHYNTKGRANMTFGGYASREEMCITFLFVYPAHSIGSCGSAAKWFGTAADTMKFTQDFVSNKLGYKMDKPEWFETVMNRMQTENAWTPERIKALEAAGTGEDNLDMCFDAALKPAYGWGGWLTMYTPLDAMSKPSPVAPDTCAKQPNTVIGK